MQKHAPEPMDVNVRPALQTDLPEADGVIRVAFGTAAGVPSPELFFGDMGIIQNRWKARDTTILVAESEENIVSSVSVTRWGSFGFFGPFGVRPDLWDRGVAKTVMASVMDLLDQWGVRLSGLYTMPGSPKHIGLYQRFGFRPQFLTAVMTKSLPAPPADETPRNIVTYSALLPEEKDGFLDECRRLTGDIFDGLDVTAEIEAVENDHLGDTVLVRNGSRLAGFAVCHLGPGTEAGSDTCYVKFAAAVSDAPPGPFEDLLSACTAHARNQGASRLTAGISTARREAYEMMLGKGFRTGMLGVAMLRPDTAGWNRPGVFVLDDWR
jgi:GNAT superfamily N-acetyltransferase